MNISYNWLRELIETDLTAGELAERLTRVGLAVDTVHEFVAGGDAAKDYVLEVDVTSNRPDCLSHLGVAREVAAIEDKRLNTRAWQNSKIQTAKVSGEDAGRIENRELDLCPRYAARIVRGVKVAQSPMWMVNRLEAIGQRAINNVADITNYVLHEVGQPLHAFDLNRLTDERIIVRRATVGETITTLDEVERTLDAEMLVIADAVRPVAVAGVMGGLASGVHSDTTNVLIESAYFIPSQVRRTRRKLNLQTEAANHFERGTDPEGVPRALERAVDLIWDIAGGTPDVSAIDIYPRRSEQPAVRLRFARIGALVGLNIAAENAREILKRLSFTEREHEDGAALYVAPSWRVDIEREEDLIEEVVRHTGIDRIPSRLPLATTGGEYLPNERARRLARRTLTQAGYDEAINFSFIDPNDTREFAVLPTLESDERHDENSDDKEARHDGAVDLSNPIIENLTRMRASLLPGLLNAVRHNLNHGTRDVRLFEIGRVFASRDDVASDKAHDEREQHRPLEREALGMVAIGGNREANRFGVARPLDFYDLKGALEAVIENMKLPALEFKPKDFTHLRSGQSARISLHGKAIGSMGRLAEAIETRLKLKQSAFVAEVDFNLLLDANQITSRYRPLARFPIVARDTSIIINRQTTFAAMRNSALEIGTEICRDVRFVDVYEGANLPDGFRSLTLRAVYSSDERTLRDEEVDAAHRSLVQTLVERFDAQPRE
ncbi:MAG: phenylalanine--tRNA ligase subunit beta [Pyrinomonadaceae bacterium MAG19_C2-C3]|nr:phenylalanine--tRNA ligase subunit beta [Pyrinomonadaceae bacterium MAG19_C2-C3]